MIKFKPPSESTMIRIPKPGAPAVPEGKQLKEGVEYGCGRSDCDNCYENISSNRRNVVSIPPGTRCDSCPNPALLVLSRESSPWCAEWFVGYYCGACYEQVNTLMWLESDHGKVQTPSLHRYDYVEVGGKRERTRVDKVYVWAAVHTPTGEVELDDVRQFDDQLEEMVEGFEWRKFRMIPYEDK